MKWIDKFLSRKDYVGVTIVSFALAIIALWGYNIYKDKVIERIREECTQRSLIAAQKQQAREDTIRREAKQEVAIAYKKAFDNQEDRVKSLESTLDQILNKSSRVSNKYDKIQQQIDAVSGTQRRIEQVIPKQ